MFKHRSHIKEIEDNLQLNHPDLKKNLLEMARYNRWFGSKKVFLHSVKEIYKKFPTSFQMNTLQFCDLGCGSGDLLIELQTWLQQHKLNSQLTGVDANAFVIQVTKPIHYHSSINFYTENIFSESFSNKIFDIASLNSICHHFSDAELVTLLKQLTKQTRLAIIINDLHRHPLPYFFIKIFTKLFASHISNHDGPLSVLRAFKKRDWQKIFLDAGIKNYQLKWRWPFRWEIIIWTQIQHY